MSGKSWAMLGRVGGGNTDFPAYSDTGYSDTPVTVTVLALPKL